MEKKKKELSRTILAVDKGRGFLFFFGLRVSFLVLCLELQKKGVATTSSLGLRSLEFLFSFVLSPCECGRCVPSSPCWGVLWRFGRFDPNFDLLCRVLHCLPRPLVFILNDSACVLFQVRKKWEERANSIVGGSLELDGVGQRVVVEEQTRGNIKSNEDINRVMLMGCQNEKHASNIHDPCEILESLPISRGVFTD